MAMIKRHFNLKFGKTAVYSLLCQNKFSEQLIEYLKILLSILVHQKSKPYSYSYLDVDNSSVKITLFA